MTDERPAASDRIGPSFAHASEAEMARILDFYAVRWEYEPTTFPILWNLEGEVIESFSPDFYLPDLDMFLEMTTLKQRLVRKKNRKLRRLRELYPDIRIKLFYARDFAAMMLKYGRFSLIESLSGTVGQMAPDRSAGLATAAIMASVTAPPPLALEPLRVAVPVSPAIDGRDPSGAVEPASTSPAALRSRTAARRLRRRRRRDAVASAVVASGAVGPAGEDRERDAGGLRAAPAEEVR